MVIDVDRTVIRSPSWWQRRTRLERRIIRVALLLAFINIALVVTITLIMTKRSFKCSNRFTNQKGPVCLSSECISTASTLLRDMNLQWDPCDNFYRFTCDGFMKRTAVPDEDSVYDFVTANEDALQKQLKSIIEKPARFSETKPFRLLKKFYNTCMNTTAIENDELITIKELIGELGGWPVLERDKWNEANFDWMHSMYSMRKLGFSFDSLLSVDVLPDEKNTSRRLIVVDEAELGIAEAYLYEGFGDTIVQAYYDYAVDVAVLLGADRAVAEDEMKKSVQFEIKLAEFCLTFDEVRNVTGLYNPITIKELEERNPEIPWLSYINRIIDVPGVQLTHDEILDVSAVRYIKNLVGLLKKTPKRVLSNYIVWRIVASSVPYLTKDLFNRKFILDQITDGTRNLKPRWKECVTQASKMQLAISAIYVRKHIDKGLKDKVLEMALNIRKEFMNNLKTADWMDETTKKNALEKAESIDIHIAYPDELLNEKKLEQYYSKLEFTSDNYLKMVMTLRRFETNYRFGQLRKPVNKTDWITHSYPTDIDAYYDFTENSMRLSAGILQGIFFNKDRPTYMNYGSIGYLIGHEITHGFDTVGSEYDKDGNLKNWWNQNARNVFKNKAQCIIYQYANYTVPEINKHLNGINNQEENIADNGGVRTAYLAYRFWSRHNGPEPQLPGLDYTPNQMFWIAVGHTWCAQYRKEFLRDEVETDRHSPNIFRVLGPLRNSEYFAKDFNCPVGSRMNPENKCRVW